MTDETLHIQNLNPEHCLIKRRTSKNFRTSTFVGDMYIFNVIIIDF